MVRAPVPTVALPVSPRRASSLRARVRVPRFRSGTDALRRNAYPVRPMIARTNALIMNNAPSTEVARVSTVAPARAPNAA